ncbi:MAG: hypothetical protein KF896_14435 [Ignavibacteriae bacterium]|nr:hypothetical protein [Ignavibacteriota bacterium]
MKITVLFALIVISISGCCSGRTTNQVFIRDTTYIKVPEIIQGEGTPQIITDTLIEYVKIKDTDTVLKIKYRPPKGLMEYMIKPDTVRFDVRDTLYSIKIEERIIETPLMSKIGLLLAGVAIALVGLAIYKERKNK